MDGQLVAGFYRFNHPIHIAEIQIRANALAVEVHRQRHQADVARALTVTKQAALHAVSPGHDGQLRAGDARSAIVMRMYADTDVTAAAEVAAEILDLVGIDVRRAHFDGRGQVDDHRTRRARLPDLRHGFTNLQRKLRFGKAEGFRGVLVLPAGVRVLFTQLTNQARRARRQLDDLRFLHAEYQTAEQRGGGVIQMDGGLFRAAQGVESATDKIVPRLR